MSPQSPVPWSLIYPQRDGCAPVTVFSHAIRASGHHSEISGAGPGKVVQTFAVDPEARQLRIIVQIEGGRDRQPRTITHAYDREEH
jgi:hypothetical protein